MAIAYLYPDSTVSNSNFTVGGGQDLHEEWASTTTAGSLADDNASVASNPGVGVVTLENCDNSLLCSDCVIQSVQIQVLYYMETKGVTNAIQVTMESADGSTDYYTQEFSPLSYLDSYQQLDFTVRETYNGSDAWNDTVLDGLRLEVRGTLGGGALYINYIRAKVTYTEKLTYPTEPGDGLDLKMGALEFKNGVMVIK